MENSWFPIYDDLIRSPEFIGLTPSEKLYFWTVLGEMNITDGPFYKSDDWFAAALSLSVPMIRKARRNLAKLGLFQIKSGHLDRHGRKLATTYTEVRTNLNGGQFSQLHRTTFWRLIDDIRYGKLGHPFID